MLRKVFEQFGLATVDDLLLPNYVHHDPGLPPQMQNGREAYKQVVNMFLTGLPDMRTTVEDLIAEGDKVAARWTARGTHSGNLMGIPPTGKSVTVTGTSTHRFAGGKLAESWVNFDAMGMLQQIGAIPTPKAG